MAQDRPDVVRQEKRPNVTEPLAPGTSQQIHGGGPLVKYVTWFSIAGVFLFATYTAVGSILIPNQVQNIESKNCMGPEWEMGQKLVGDCVKSVEGTTASGIGLIVGIAAIFTLFAQPICGALSDRFRSKWGRRSPFMVVGAAAGALFMIGLQQANTVVMVMVFWILAQVALNFMQAPMTTTVADRISPEQRATVSAFSGIGTMIGAALGGVAAAALFNGIGLSAYWVFGIACLVGAILFAVGNKDRSSKDLAVDPWSWKDFFAGFARPLRDADYRWTWLARFALILGYFGLSNFNQQILQHYIQPNLSQADANTTAAMLGVVTLPGMLISMIVFGRLSDKMGRRKPFVIGASVGMAATLLIPIISPTMPAMYVYTILLSFCFGAYMTVDQALFMDVLPNMQEAGKDLGVANAATNLGQSLGPLIGGQLVLLLGGYLPVYIWAVLWSVIGGLAILPVKRVR